MSDIKTQIAKALLDIEAVFLRPDEPFTWASGIKSPIYCDNRLILTAPEVRNMVENAIADTVKREYPDAEFLMGTSTAGIAHAAIAAHILGIPMGYVRSGAKDHGRNNRIEGRLEKGQKVVVIEDLISTGGSVIEVVEALRDALLVAGVSVVGATAMGIWALDYINKNKKQKPSASTKSAPPHVYYHPLSPKKTVLKQPGDKGFQTVSPELPDDFKLDY